MKYTDANEPCKNCKQSVANHEWVEPTRASKTFSVSDGQGGTRTETREETDKEFQARRNEAQFTRGANHDATVNCKEYKPASAKD